MRYKFIGTPKDLVDLGSISTGETSDEMYNHAIIPIIRKDNIDISLWVNTFTGYIELHATNKCVLPWKYTYGTIKEEDLISTVAGVSFQDYNEAVISEKIYLDVLFKLCSKGLLEEVED